MLVKNSSTRQMLCAFLVVSVIAMVPFRSRAQAVHTKSAALAKQIEADQSLTQVQQMATALLKRGFNAGTGYNEVWIRDLNTFIEVSLEVNPQGSLRDALLTFLKFQGPDGDIVDGYVPADAAKVKYAYRLSPSAPDLMAHKNTVETDQESSLVQAVTKYVDSTGDRTILDERIDGVTVRQRLASALNYVLTQRFDEKHGLVWGATRADWGDIQPESGWGVVVDAHSHRALCVYDNAMFLIAVEDYLHLLGPGSPEASKWTGIHDRMKQNVRKFLWDEKRQKFIPHVYLDGSPFPPNFDESAIYYHGGTAVAIEAGLLSQKEIRESLDHMVADMHNAGAASIGLTMYPPYPAGLFANSGMAPYNYQNGGDWCWFGGRMVRELIKHGYTAEAYQELRPMVERVVRVNGFYEWWTPDNHPKGSADFRGSAGMLGRDIELLEAWAAKQ